MITGVCLVFLDTSFRASLVAQRLKRLPGMRETWVRSLGQEDPLEKAMAAWAPGLPQHSVACDPGRFTALS